MLIFIFFLIFFLNNTQRANAEVLNTERFPDGFLFGVATSAYQVEGAWNESGKGESIWDYLTHNQPEYISDGSNGDIACDAYNRVNEDVELIANLGVDFYSFSLSWARILPTGFYPEVNADGLRYYNDLIDALVARNIQPMVTLYHWDLPRSIQTMGGWVNEAIADYFEDYAKVAFDNFGDRVQFWITVNDPVNVCFEGYGEQRKAPALNSTGVGDYLCMHNVLKAHARAYHLYNNEYRSIQKGNISITIDSPWLEADSDSEDDADAAERARQFTIGWVANPIFGTGDYPAVMKELIGDRSRNEGFLQSRLPEFSSDEVQYIKGSSDYFGLNHYNTHYVRDESVTSNYGIPHFDKDLQATIYTNNSWQQADASDWLQGLSLGFRKALKWTRDNYNASVIVTGNGYSDYGQLEDVNRIVYIQLYLSDLLNAIYEDGVEVKGYAFWTLMDSFGWFEGYQAKYGLYHVNFTDPSLPRTPKASVDEVKEIITNRQLPSTSYNSSACVLRHSLEMLLLVPMLLQIVVINYLR